MEKPQTYVQTVLKNILRTFETEILKKIENETFETEILLQRGVLADLRYSVSYNCNNPRLADLRYSVSYNCN